MLQLATQPAEGYNKRDDLSPFFHKNEMKPTVQLFITCIVDTLYPEVGEAVVKVLRRAGAQVEFPPGQTCCGQPAFNAGMRPEAREMAKKTIEAFENAPGMVVLPSGSCTAMVRHGYIELFREETDWLRRAQALAERTFEFSQYLVDVLGVEDLGAQYAGKLTYHASCHLLRDLGVREQPRKLLSRVAGAELIELPYSKDCCGFGGLFSVEHAHISSAMLDRKLTNIQETGADVVVACDAGCLTHINGGLHRKGKRPCGMHLAEILEHRAT
jgi:L-lactate dehydrogenase complex protein LldE